ncbi:MAG TPA: hypothetical protein VLW85_04590 [Myxococcales bacterium]|nr:hypothetical protein [Myxococcales bacterium]
MHWTMARERLGAELIGAREAVAQRWRRTLRDQGLMPWALDRCALELILQAGAALADGAPGEAPWRRCGALLRVDMRDQGRSLAAEITRLWHAMAATISSMSLSIEEEQHAKDVLSLQLDAALRGSAAELRAALLDEHDQHDAPRFGGPVAACWPAPPEPEATERAA